MKECNTILFALKNFGVRINLLMFELVINLQFANVNLFCCNLHICNGIYFDFLMVPKASLADMLLYLG